MPAHFLTDLHALLRVIGCGPVFAKIIAAKTLVSVLGPCKGIPWSKSHQIEFGRQGERICLHKRCLAPPAEYSNLIRRDTF